MGMSTVDPQFHVLAVDDSLIDRKLIERLLKTSSYQVTTVDSGSKALEFLGWHDDYERSNSKLETSVSPKNQQEMEINLVITDYCMPGMTGYDLLKKMKESSSLKDIPVVIMSSENVPSRINRCLEEGAEEFFLKPVRLSDVSKLRPHMMKTKCCPIENKKQGEEEPAKQENIKESSSSSSSSELQTAQSQEQQQQETTQSTTSANNKRKSIEQGLSPDRTRPRYSDLTVTFN